MRLLAAVFLLALAAQPSPGRITGVVRDTGGGVLPGTTITLRADGIERTAVTDPAGAFTFTDVPAGRYTLVARLVGFDGATRSDVIVSTGESVTVNLTLKVGCLAHASYVDMGLAWVLKHSHVVAHIRIPALDLPGACVEPSYCACSLHHATVLRTLHGSPPGVEIRLVQDGAGVKTQERPYQPGDEFIAFLIRSEKNRGFDRTSNFLYMFPVRNGRVDLRNRQLPGFTDGMTVAEFEKALRNVR